MISSCFRSERLLFSSSFKATQKKVTSSRHTWSISQHQQKPLRPELNNRTRTHGHT